MPMEALKDVVTRAPGPLRCRGLRGKVADVFLQMDPGKWRKIPSNAGVHQGNVFGPALIRMPLGTRLGSQFGPKG